MAAAKKPEDNDNDDVMKSIQLLRDDLKAAHAAFVKKGPTLDLAGVIAELGEIYSMQADLSGLLFQSTYEQFDWAGEVDDEIEAIRAELGGASSLLPEDAERLKATILALSENLSPSLEPAALAALKARAEEAVAFIDEASAEETEEDEDETES